MTQFGQSLDETRTTTSTTTTTSSSSTSSTRSRACAEIPGDVLTYIGRSYEDAIGSPMSVSVAKYIDLLLDGGMDPGLILDAIDQTAWAPRPSPHYLRAVLQRYLLDGLSNALEAEEQRMQRRANKAYRMRHPNNPDELPI